MPETSRVLFVGAGASRVAGLPITSELWHGLAFALCEISTGPGLAHGRLHRLYRFLRHVYGITEEELRRSATFWTTRFKERKARAVPPRFDPPVPAITELLATIDVLLSEGSILAVRPDGENFNVRETARVRDQVVRTLGHAFGNLAEAPNLAAVRRLIAPLRSSDTIVTTNWDLLLDTALDQTAGTAASDYGTDAIIAKSRRTKPRPRLLKLHGSFNWLVCDRCTRLYVDPTVPISTLPDDDDQAVERRRASKRPGERRCHCGAVLSPLLIAPTYLKDYRSRHLGNIWAQSLTALAGAGKWIFVGYSLPDDDFHIRVMLQKAAHMRRTPPQITIVNPDTSVTARFSALLRHHATLSPRVDGLERFLATWRKRQGR